ncbi:MAG: D-cysteine desulfhydrase family protein [Rhizobiaceae bacterium]
MFQEEFKLLPGLLNNPRVELGMIKTSIDPLNRMGKELGVRLSTKRDDTLPLAMGGNKMRQLEYYLGPAADAGADTVLITGAVQSNFVRLCAAAARKMGWHPVVQLEDRVPSTDPAYNNSGNVLIDRLLGADIHYFPEGENEAAADANLDALAADLINQGRKPYVIHLGTDHPPLGGLGYALCAVETFVQLQQSGQNVDHIVIPSGSSLTHAGFLAGARAIGWQVPVHGICVRRNADLQKPRVLQRTQEVLQLLGNPASVSESDVIVDDTVLHPGYGRLNDEVIEAITLAAQSEALLLDPVYTGRAMAGLIDLTRKGIIGKDQSALFIHTGGLPALFAYENKLREYAGW